MKKIIIMLMFSALILFALEYKTTEKVKATDADWIVYMTNAKDSLQRDSIGQIVTARVRDSLKAVEHREIARAESLSAALRLAMIDSSKAVWDDSTNAALVVIPNDLRVGFELTLGDTLHIGDASLIDGSGDLDLYNTNFNVIGHNIVTNKELSATDTTRINNAKLINKGASNTVQFIAPADKTGNVYLDGADVSIRQNNLTFGNGASVTNPSSGIISVNATTLNVPTDSAYIHNVLKTDTAKVKRIEYLLDQIRIQLPDTISAVVGDTLQIFYRGFIEAKNPYDYQVLVTGAKGNQYNRYFEYAPVAADTVTNNYMTIFALYNDQMVLLAKDTTYIHVQKAWQPTVATILPIGDSFTYTSYWPTEFYRRLTGTGGTPAGNAFTGLSTLGNLGSAPNKRMGYSGKSWSFYLAKTSSAASLIFYFFGTHDKDASDNSSIWSDGTNNWSLTTASTGKIKFTKSGHTVDPPASGTLTHVSGATHTANITYTTIETLDGNPLWDYNNNQLNFLAYCTRNSYADIDVAIPLLSWNGLTSYQTDFTTIIGQAKQFCDSLKSQYPNAKVLLCPCTMPPVYNGMAGYGISSVYNDYFGMLISVVGLNKAYQSISQEAAYKDWVFYTNITSQFDSEYGFTHMTKKPYTRYIGTTREINSYNAVHPSEQGYYQIADAVYRQFVRYFCK